MMNISRYKEDVPHGNILFPMAAHITPSEGLGYEKLYCHWHEELEFLVVTEGAAEFHIGTRSLPVHAGEAIFIGPNQLHSATALDGLPCGFFAVVVNPTLMLGHTDDLIQLKYIDPVLSGKTIFPEHVKGGTDWGSQVIGLLCRIRDLYLGQDSGFELLIKSCLLEIWHLMSLHSDREGFEVGRSHDYRVAKIKTVLNHIHQNYAQEITLGGLASIAHLSEGQFCRFFKQMVKMSAINYIKYVRVSKSIALLENTDRKISDIAGSVGFGNTSYFCKVFREFMHCTPTEYKQGDPVDMTIA